jgi:hypothetical protein
MPADYTNVFGTNRFVTNLVVTNMFVRVGAKLPTGTGEGDEP